MEKLNVGDNVYWIGEAHGYEVMAKDERYLIVSKQALGETLYSIIDTVDGVCSTDDRVISMYKYGSKFGASRALADINSGDVGLSKRNKASINDVVDVKRTIN